MKSKEEIIKAVETAQSVVRDIYANDPRAKNPKQQNPDSGFAQETKIVFKEVLRYLLNK
jgi:hypothetical protein